MPFPLSSVPGDCTPQSGCLFRPQGRPSLPPEARLQREVLWQSRSSFMHLISLSGFAIQFTVLLFSIFITKAPSLQQDESKLSLGHTFSRHFLPASLVLSSPAHVRKAERQRGKGGGGWRTRLGSLQGVRVATAGWTDHGGVTLPPPFCFSGFYESPNMR